MMAFAFPEKDPDSLEEDHDMDKKSKKKEKKKNKNTSFYVQFPGEKDDVEKMKERAERNHLFAYIKIPEVPIQFSFKGAKEKDQILDVANFQLQVPTLEYHDVTWTWFDLLLAIKSRYKDSLVAQAIKQKLMRSKVKSEGPEVPGEEEKVRLLLGRAVGQAPGSGRSSKRFFKK